MPTISLDIPEDIARHLKLPRGREKRILTQELALRLFEEGIITAAQGARLIGMDRLAFERLLAENEIPMHGGPKELVSDLANVERAQ